jgi:hypothetical protein
MICLKRFNESNDSELLDTIISNCKDILIDLSDDGFEYKIISPYSNSRESNEIIINIGNPSNNYMIKLAGYELVFNHLFNYLESNGFKLCNKLSYFENDTWDYHEACPECDSQLITVTKVMDEYFFVCDKCEFGGYQDDFLSPQHPITKDELLWSIRKNYFVQWISLVFWKDKKN